MRILRWSLDALADLDRIDEFNAERGERWTARVHDRILQRCDTLRVMPFQGRPRRDGWRSLSLPDVQYVIWYEVDDDGVTINRIWSTRQNRGEP